MEILTPVPASRRFSGVVAPVATPFDDTLAPDAERFVRHCRWLLDHGCAGLAVFGTTSEANSLSVEERMLLLEALVEAGIDPAVLMPGTGCSALTDSVRLTAHAASLGCAGVLMLPPFYYKDVDDEGLFRSFAEVIERVGDARLRVYLYHIPPIAHVGFSFALIERLLGAYPAVIAGIKDSSGDWSHTARLLAEFGTALDVFVGSEGSLLACLRGGGAGTITAGANVNPHGIRALYGAWQGPDAESLQAGVGAVRAVLQRYPLIAAAKAVIANAAGDPGWARVRPPLRELDEAQAAILLTDLRGLGFAMPGFETVSAGRA